MARLPVPTVSRGVLAVVPVLLSADDPITVAELVRRINGTVSAATVRRVVDTLVDLEWIDRVRKDPARGGASPFLHRLTDAARPLAEDRFGRRTLGGQE